MAGAYMGKYCIIDLNTGQTEAVEPGDAFYQKYLSGYGLGAAVITERQKPGVDPLSPESYLGFCSGLLTGTGASFSGRFMVVAKSPLTGGWGDANAGGFLSREIKRTGYDAVFFTGAAQKPVWVNITDSAIEIKDASSLWGKDIEYLSTSRPTAVNLFWALERMEKKLNSMQGASIPAIKQGLLEEAEIVLQEDKSICRKIGEYGAELVNNGDIILTHCNAGALATADY